MNKSKERIAIVSREKCKPVKCRQECKKNCPVVRMGKFCIEVEKNSKYSTIEESLCIGCGICVKKCPFDAIQIVNLNSSPGKNIIHRYGGNSFRIYSLPIPKPGSIIGIIGTNGIGKSTALKILGGKILPNMGLYESIPDIKMLKNYFRGGELQNYFNRIIEKKMKVVVKPQYVDIIPETIKGKIIDIFDEKSEKKDYKKIINLLDLEKIVNRETRYLSGGELQRFAIGLSLVQKYDSLLIDEMSSYLDIKQKIEVAKIIRNELEKFSNIYIIIVEHDLSIIDYLSDFICCLYGKPGAYGVVSVPYSVKEGINIFLSGYIPSENLRFRESSIDFSSLTNNTRNNSSSLKPDFTNIQDKVELKDFKLTIMPGNYFYSEIIILLGENGTGKTTFVKYLGGFLKGINAKNLFKSIKISYKPQKISPDYRGSVGKLISDKLYSDRTESKFKEMVVDPLNLEMLKDKQLSELSGGELQRLAIALCLSKNAELYLIDEPSAYLDSEQRIIVSKIIKKFASNSKKIFFIVEHDFLMITYLGEKIIYFEGNPGISCKARSPMSLSDGINCFLKDLNITFRRDPVNKRPRINKLNSVKDKEQKKKGQYVVN
jgi:ATP-binding cassette subfamily E protein 1